MSEPKHDLIDFVALSKQLTNEQKILACLERIEALLTPVKPNPYPGATGKRK